MKTIYLLLLILIFPAITIAQQNLVPNPSFEDTVYCPFALTQIDACTGWSSYGLTPDYFNACTLGGLNVPNSSLGYQFSHSGVGMAGIVIYADPNSSAGPNAREFIGCQLINQLAIGHKYYFSFFANCADPINIAIASNKLGLNFYMQSYSTCCPPLLNNNPIFYSDSILKDSVVWIKFESSFVADSNYRFLSIGNFFDDQHTDTVNLSTSPYVSYYYIDDVCVTEDSLYNHLWTGLINKTIIEDVEIYPNPTNSILNITSKFPISSLSILDISGREIINISDCLLSQNKQSLNLSSLSSGSYFAIIKFKNNAIITKKIIISP